MGIPALLLLPLLLVILVVASVVDVDILVVASVVDVDVVFIRSLYVSGYPRLRRVYRPRAFIVAVCGVLLAAQCANRGLL